MHVDRQTDRQTDRLVRNWSTVVIVLRSVLDSLRMLIINVSVVMCAACEAFEAGRPGRGGVTQQEIRVRC